MSAIASEKATPAVKDIPEKDTQTSKLNSPNLDAKGKPQQRAISSAKQAHNIGKTVVQYAKTEGRLDKAGVINDKYGGEAPFKSADLRRAGQGWRNNYSTNFMASIIDRVKPQLTDPVNKTDRLTHSSLPETFPNAAEKSRIFGTKVTNTIRQWPEWKDLIGRLAQDVSLFGNAAPARIDENWRPRLFRHNETFLHDGAGQHATKIQYAVFVEDMFLHDFLNLFKDEVAAEKAGYNIDGCVKVGNASSEKKNDTDDALAQSDRARDGASLADTFASGTRTVKLMHVLVHDFTGEVDLWTVAYDDGTEVRNVKGVHGRIDDGTALFTAQTGNGHFYGSKGLGRTIGNLHIAIERGRCMGHDLLCMAGLPIFKGDVTKAIKVQARVMYPWIVIPTDWELAEKSFEFNYEAFAAMDANLVRTAESIAGAFIPPAVDKTGQANTKIEAAQRAERELSVKEGVLGRWFDQIGELVGMMQRGLFSYRNLREGKRAYDEKKKKEETGFKVIKRLVYKLLERAFGVKKLEAGKMESESDSKFADPQAVSLIVDLLEAGLSVEEIATLALTPSTNNNSDEGAAKDDRTMQFIALNAANPYINQKAATKISAEIMVGKDRANELLSNEEDPNEIAIAKRQQIIEFGEMLDGREMPVAQTDNHLLHRKTLAEVTGQLMQGVATAPTVELIQTCQLCLAHYEAHLQMDAIKTPPDKAKQEQAVIDQWRATLDAQQKTLDELAAQIEAQGIQGGPNALPGAPVQGEGDGTLPGEREDAKAKLALDGGALAVALRNTQVSEDSQLLEREKFEHKKTLDMESLKQDGIKTALAIAKEEGAQARAAADAERRATETKST